MTGTEKNNDLQPEELDPAKRLWVYDDLGVRRWRDNFSRPYDGTSSAPVEPPQKCTKCGLSLDLGPISYHCPRITCPVGLNGSSATG